MDKKFLFILIGFTVLNCQAQDDGGGAEKAGWNAMEKLIVRLDPSAFPSMPRPMRSKLKSMGCTIPQSGGTSERKPHNVVIGRFEISTRIDWATLCSVNGKSKILVFRGGSSDVIEVSGTEDEDRHWLQGGVGYSRFLGGRPPEGMESFKDQLRRNPELDSLHESVEEYFVEKYYVVYRLENGKWERFDDDEGS
jgi:hypothetical protein